MAILLYFTKVLVCNGLWGAGPSQTVCGVVTYSDHNYRMVATSSNVHSVYSRLFSRQGSITRTHEGTVGYTGFSCHLPSPSQPAGVKNLRTLQEKETPTHPALPCTGNHVFTSAFLPHFTGGLQENSGENAVKFKR